MIDAGIKVKLRNKRVSDALNDYTWQSDQLLAELDAAPLLNMSFTEYLSCYMGELRNPPGDRRMFAVETLEGKHIGNCVYYNINEGKGEAELGVMIGNREYWDRGYGAATVDALVDLMFRQTSLQRIYLKTLESNGRARRCFQKCGFLPYSHLSRDGYKFVLMELHRSKWEEKQKESVSGSSEQQ